VARPRTAHAWNFEVTQICDSVFFQIFGREAERKAPMLRSLNDLEQYAVSATDGDIGSVANFLLDDKRWTVRYLVVKAGGYFTGRQVLISPISFQRADWTTHRFHLALTKDKVKDSPSVDVDEPVSRQFERDYYRYYNYPYYWGSTGVWGVGGYPALLGSGTWIEPADLSDEEHRDPHLRSAKELTGYHIHGSDGVIGHIADFMVDDDTWELRYLVVQSAHWWVQGKKVLVAPCWASAVSWIDREVHVDLTRQAIKNSPEWDPGAVINREYESRLYDYYGRPVYWDHNGFPDRAWYSAPVENRPPF
jgi:hypothetical protein